jgi:hypothetical protein
MANMGKRFGVEIPKVVNLSSIHESHDSIHKIEDVFDLKTNLNSSLEIQERNNGIWYGFKDRKSTMVGQFLNPSLCSFCSNQQGRIEICSHKRYYWFSSFHWVNDQRQINLLAFGSISKDGIKENVYLFSASRLVRGYSRILISKHKKNSVMYAISYSPLAPCKLSSDLEEIHDTNGCDVFDMFTLKEFYEELPESIQKRYWNLSGTKSHPAAGFFLNFENNFFIKYNKKTKRILFHM